MAAKLNTVNVIEIPDTMKMSIAQLISFTDDEEGNKQAEEVFKKIVGEMCENMSDDEKAAEMEFALEEGYYDDDNGYYACIVHSCEDKDKGV